MAKALSDMSIEELWELFPIILTKYNEEWNKWYQQEETLLIKSLTFNNISRISHIGSTAIPNIWAKPTVDILVELKKSSDMQTVKSSILRNGYLCMSEEKNRISFNKGYTEHGFAKKVFHLHLRMFGDNDELYFRDYMIEHPSLASQYEELKLSLWKKYEHDRDGYTNAKGEFIKQFTQMAKLEYDGRYN